MSTYFYIFSEHSGNKQEVIKTVHGRGYQFVVDVDNSESIQSTKKHLSATTLMESIYSEPTVWQPVASVIIFESRKKRRETGQALARAQPEIPLSVFQYPIYYLI